MSDNSLNRFFLSIVLPSIVAIGLFILIIFIVILPSFEKNIMEVKKEMISELTNTAWSLIEEYHQEVIEGNMEADSAKDLAAKRIKKIRYGDEYKDYFWIIDLQPIMIMHPYRSELVGKDLTAYEDPDGKRLFLEAAQIAQSQGQGYIDYMWQWKDDSTRIVPKLSFVKEFEPWNWVVGTGIYLEDVRSEISFLKNRLLRIALLITLIISIILAFIIRQSLMIENKRKNAENKLRLSRQKYKSLVEASTEGTLMVRNKEIIFSNIKFSELSGCDPFEVRKLKFEDIFEIPWEKLTDSFDDPKKSVSLETRLNCKNGSRKDVVISASQINLADQTGYIIIVKELSIQQQFEKANEFLTEELQTSLLLMDQTIKPYIDDIKKCSGQTTVREAASIMTRKQKNVLFINQGDEIIGVINNNDLKKRILAENISPDKPVIEFMTSPVLSISENAPVYEVLLKLKNNNISHLLTFNAENRVSGVIGYENLFEFQQNIISYMIKEIEEAEDIIRIKFTYRRLPVLIGALIESGSKTISLTRIITGMNDAVHKRLIEMAIEDLGVPPCRFSFMVLGSEGRKEQTMATDQDNAIVFENRKGQSETEVRDYFLSLGELVNKSLHDTGYHYCKGDIMAKNPKWTKSLDEWKRQFSEWINASSPNDVLEASIFFDFRSVYGEETFVSELREHVNRTSDNKSVFFYHMVQEALKFKPPVNVFGNIVGNGSESDELRMDIKKVLFPLVSFIRLYSIREKISETNSLERTARLLSKGIIDRGLYEEISRAWSFMTYLRLRFQINSIAQNEMPGNMINLNAISRLEQNTLKKIFSEIAELQTKVKFDFKGSEG